MQKVQLIQQGRLPLWLILPEMSFDWPGAGATATIQPDKPANCRLARWRSRRTTRAFLALYWLAPFIGGLLRPSC